jgi:hypothetical protein
MSLNIQIFSIAFSILYGIIFGVLYNISYNFLYNNFSRYRILINFLFTTNIFLIYFIIMLKINNGNIRLTFLILLFLNFIIFSNLTKSLRKIVKCSKSMKQKHLNKK